MLDYDKSINSITIHGEIYSETGATSGDQSGKGYLSLLLIHCLTLSILLFQSTEYTVPGAALCCHTAPPGGDIK